MASSNITEKAKLLQELQFYTSLVSNHVKRLETSKAPGIKRSVLIKPFENNGKLGNSSQSPKVCTPAGAFPQKPVASQTNKYQRFVVQSGKLKCPQNPTTSLLSKRSVIKPSLTNINRNLPTVTSLKKINSNQPIFVPNTKQVVTKGAVSSRSVLPPQSTLKVINGTASNLFTPASDRSKDLQKTLTETKKVFVKIGAAKHIDELNKLTKQLEKKKMVSALKTSNSLNKILANSPNVSINTKSKDLKSTANCNSLSKMNSLKSRVENIAKILATTSNNSSKKVPNKSTSGILCPTKRVVDSHKIMKNKPCSILPNTKIDHKLLLPSSQDPEAGKLQVAQLETITKYLQSTTPVRKEMNLQNCNSMKNSLDLLQTVKHESIQKKNSPRLSRSSSKLNVHKLVKSPKPLQTCLLTPLTKKVWLQKLNASIKKQGIKTKIISSKYKVVNKNISSSAVVSSQNKFTKHKLTIPSNSFNKRFQSIPNVPCNVKKISSKHKVVNIIKSPKQFKSTMLKTSTPRIAVQAKSALKKRRLSANGFTPGQNGQLKKSFSQKPVLQPKLITKHKVNNYLIKTTTRNTPKLFLNKKSAHLTGKNTKFKVVNFHGSSKRLSKSPKLKQDVVRRTKSGVDMDLLLEIAAEKEQSERENGMKTVKKRAVLLKRVYKTKNAIINKNVSSSTGTKVAKMIKAKYSFNRRHAWQKQLVSKRFNTYTHKTGQHYGVNFQRTPIKQFYNTRRNYFKPKSQNQKHKIRHRKGLMHFNRSYQKSFTQQNHLRKQVMSTPISKVLANRVLHRSINRVLTASVKRELKKSSKVNTYCMFYNRFGRCNKGLNCVYVHDPSKIAVCTRFLRGTCKNEKCLFSHEINPGKMAICSFFLLGSCTKTECPYRHETLSADAQLCKAFVQGYCPDGKQCKKAHVLVCPKYIQGLCDKGNACAFPHPPQKEKKNFPKTVEKTETPVETEDFMEKVSRYFQPASGQDTKTFETRVVPKRQIIPEQPSFISL